MAPGDADGDEMCRTGVTTETEWQRQPPDSPGEWLWIISWSCGCVHQAGIAWVPSDDDLDQGPLDEVLPSGLRLSWEGQRHEGASVEDVTAWRRIGLPPVEMLA